MRDIYVMDNAKHDGRCMRCGKNILAGQDYYRNKADVDGLDPETWDWHCIKCHGELTQNDKAYGGWKPIQKIV